MKLTLYILMLLSSLNAFCQLGEKSESGYFIDKFGTRYDGFLRLEPGDGKKPGELIFKETRKGKKEIYGPDYIKAFKIENDSFSILKNIPIQQNKIQTIDFVKILLVGPGGVLYFHEYLKQKSSGHAAANFKISEDNAHYLTSINGKVTGLNKNNFKNFGIIVSDYEDLKMRIQSGKVKFADLQKIIEEYTTFKSQQATIKQ